MVDWLILIAAACACAMHGTPIRWSSLPVILIATVTARAVGGVRPAGKVTLLMRLVPATVLASAAWLAAVAIVRLDQQDGIALLGGMGALTCGFWLGRASSGSDVQVNRFFSSLAIGYSAHAVILLSWFIQSAGWSVPDLVRLRWDPAHFDESAGFGFGNLGNNAVVAAMLVPMFLTSALGAASTAQRAIGAAALFLGLGVLGILQARAAIFATTVTAVVLLAALRSWRTLALLAACTLLTELAFNTIAAQFEDNAVRRIIDALAAPNDDASFRERVDSIAEGWKISLEHPWAGIGGSKIPLTMTHSAPHQWHLHQALEWGMPVAIAAAFSTIAVFASFFRSVWLTLNIGKPWDQVMICLSIPATYLMVGSIAGAQWHYGMASVWPALSGLGFGMAWAVQRERRTSIAPIDPLKSRHPRRIRRSPC